MMNPARFNYLSAVACCIAAGVVFHDPVQAQGVETRPSNENPKGEPHDLTQVSLEDLMNMEVSSVSKQKERLSDAAAAIYVITSEELRRSGVTSIPEALRMVPGLTVARINANSWAISSRGFVDQFANKMLVLVDGRTVYTGMFSGVYWDMQDYPLEDIERIEVIRGPGGTLWGANAVNGVINIITKNSADTQGGLVHAGGGSEERFFTTIRYGGKITEDIAFRIFGKYFDQDASRSPAGGAADDDWHMARAGFRSDMNITKNDRLMVQGGIHRGNEGTFGSIPLLAPPFSAPYSDNVTVEGEHVLARWEHEESKTSDLALQLYYDTFERDERLYLVRENTVDLDFQHRFEPVPDHNFLWGLGYRLKSTLYDSAGPISFNPERRETDVASGFAQDTIDLSGDRLKLTIGSKFEHNDYTGLEIQPSARVAWVINDKNTIWGAVSRAVRTPSPVDRDLKIDLSAFPLGGGVGESEVFGTHGVNSEDLIAYELGYRTRPGDSIFIDISAFVNSYNNLRSNETEAAFVEATPAPVHTVIPVRFRNRVEGETYGVELASTWAVRDHLKFHTGYSFMNIELNRSNTSNDTNYKTLEGTNPQHQVFTRASLDLAKDVDLDIAAKFVDRLPAQGVRAYVKLDARVAWRVRENIELSLTGVNLADTTHREFGTPTIEHPTLIERAVVAAIVIRF